MTNLITANNLKVIFESRYGLFGQNSVKINAVNDVSFNIKKGHTVGLVGESGSGKSTIGRSLCRLVKLSQGDIRYEGREIASLSNKEYYPYRKKIQMIFQDPFDSLNPRMRVADIIAEPMTIGHKYQKSFIIEKVECYLLKVGLSLDMMYRFPHEFSGGQRQRIGIARALAADPEFIICDEPVSALDVSVQAQIVNLLKDLQDELNLTYLFIAHDLAIVEHMSDWIMVMKNGEIVEQGLPEKICEYPKHEYTQQLIRSVPSI